MQLKHRLSALRQLHLHPRLNTCLHWIGQRQLQDETRNIEVWGFGASYIGDFTVIKFYSYTDDSTPASSVTSRQLQLLAHLFQPTFHRYVKLCLQEGQIQWVHDDVIKWKYFPRNWPFVRKGQWHGALMFSLICVRINAWVNNREAGDLRRHGGHYDVIVMNLHW